MADVCLIFPPTVSSGFGRYYPASAVLAAWLTEHGIVASQVDLNTALALDLIAPAFLAEAGAGRFFADGPGIETTAMPAVAARLLAKNRPRLFDAQGRHDFADPEGPGFLLHELAKPINIDCPIEAIAARPGLVAWQLAFYETFYARRGTADFDDPGLSLFGITVAMGPQLAPACALAGHLKRLRPDVRIVCGGPALSLLNEEDLALLLRHVPAIDAIGRFDGEEPLLALAKQAQSGGWRPHDVPNVSARGSDGGIVHAVLKPGPSLHQLPAAAYDPALIQDMQAPELGIVQARGCYWGECAYCDFVELYGASRAFRSRTADAVVEEIARQKEATGATRFTLITEAIPPGFSLRFAKLLIARGLAVSWNSFAMVDHRFTPEHFSLMAQSGCDHLVIGLETMTDRVLQLVRKAATQDRNLVFLEGAAAAGIRLYVNLIPDLPSTTHREAMAALDVLRDVQHCLANVTVFPFEATRSSDVGRDPAAFGLTLGNAPTTTGQAEFTANHLGACDTAMTDAERRAAIDAYRDFAAQVNAARAAGGMPQPGPAGTARETLFRVAEADIDIALSGEGAQLFNWRKHRGWSGPRGIAALTARLNGSTFDQRAFFDLAGGDEIGTALWQALLRMGVLEPAAP
jgi:hypothetical protein